MAINKSSSPAWVKIVIIVVVAAFALSVIIGSGAIFGGGSDQPEASAVEETAQQYRGVVDSNDQALASQPSSATLLVVQGNTYFDWAAQVQGGSQSGADKPIWLSAVYYYEAALKDKATAADPAVNTDLSVAYYNAGLLAKAISQIEPVTAKNPEFAPAFFNAGIFYRSAGRSADAVKALQRYLQLDPNGQTGNAQLAQQYLTELGSAAATATP